MSALDTVNVKMARKPGDLAGADKSGPINVPQTVADSDECPTEEKLKL